MADKGRYVYDWPRPMVTVEAIVFCTFPAGRKVLLIQRGQEPGKGLWAAPGGFLELDEEMEDGAARELAEETGLTGVDLIQFQTFGNIGRDPRGRVITVAYVGTITPEQADVRAGDDAAEAKWFLEESLPEKMAFDHDHVVSQAWAFYKRHISQDG